MNNSGDTNNVNSQDLVLYIIPKIILFFMGIKILEYINQYNLSLSQFVEHNIELKILNYLIPLVVITIFAFYRLKLIKYLVISLSILFFISIIILQKPVEDPFRRFMEDIIYYVIGSFIGGLLVTEALIDKEKVKGELIQFVKSSVSRLRNF